MSNASFVRGAAVAVALFLAAPAWAAITVIAEQSNPSPVPGLAYQRFNDSLDVSDAPGERVVVNGSLRGKLCFFSIDPAADPDSVVVCRRDVTPDNRAFTRFGPPSINGTGTVAFASRVTAGRSGVYRDGTSIVALFGDAAPCLGTSPILEQLAYGRITDTGAVAFTGTMSGCTDPLATQAVLLCSGGDGNCSTQPAFLGAGVRTTIASAGDAVPDRPGRFFCSFQELDASIFGVVFRATTKVDCADNMEVEAVGVFRKEFGGLGLLQTVALQGESAQPMGTVYGSPVLAPAISNAGMVAFNAQATTGTLPTTYIYLCDPATCPVPGAVGAVSIGQADDVGNVFKSFSAPGVDDAGNIGFSARVRSTLSPATRDGLYRAVRMGMGFDIVTIAVSDDPVPGTMPTEFFRALPGPSAMSSSGKVVSRAKINRTSRPRRANAVIIDE